MKRYQWIVLIILITGAFAGYWGRSSLIGVWPGSTEVIPVKLGRVQRGTISYVVERSGKIEPVTQLTVVSPIPGQVQEIRYKIGDWVAEGQVVGLVRSKELLQRAQKEESELKAARAVVAERERQLSVTEEQLEKFREFRRKDFISTQELKQAETAAETARAQHDLAKAQVEQREAALVQTRYLLSLGRLVAPFSGVLVRRALEPGARVSASSPILTLAGLDPLKVVVDLADKDARLVQEGMSARIRVDEFPDRLFDGKVAGVDSTAEAATPTVRADVQLSNQNRVLRPDMAAHVSLVLATDDALLVPSAAVIEDGGENFVYVVVDGAAMRKVVRTGRKHEKNIIVTDGVSEGELIVVSGQEKLRPNSRVRVQEHTESRMEDRR